MRACAHADAVNTVKVRPWVFPSQRVLNKRAGESEIRHLAPIDPALARFRKRLPEKQAQTCLCLSSVLGSSLAKGVPVCRLVRLCMCVSSYPLSLARERGPSFLLPFCPSPFTSSCYSPTRPTQPCPGVFHRLSRRCCSVCSHPLRPIRPVSCLDAECQRRCALPWPPRGPNTALAPSLPPSPARPFPTANKNDLISDATSMLP